MTMHLSSRAQALLGQSGESPPEAGVPMDPAAIRAVLDALNRGETHYTDRPGIQPLRKKVAEGLSLKFALPFQASDIIITCGATEGRFVTLQQIIAAGDNVAAPDHAERIAGGAVIRGAKVSTDLTAAKLLYVASSSGQTAIETSLSQVAADCLVLFEVDDAESDFHPSQVSGFSDRVITVGDLGTMQDLASARIGYLAAPAQTANGLRDFKQALTICSTNLSQWAALAVVEDL
ncbi:hypothetical protein [Microvirga antarctica]|uniref:hypothetical protein n=1 Tax=Microvirga antarctica TaxID=2819233 RepID=UPI001B30E086|nr:hypothetical protein [Microvirga antarctica]